MLRSKLSWSAWGGTTVPWTDGDGKPVAGTTVWSIGSAQSDHFAPSAATVMVNYRVEPGEPPPGQ